MKGVPGILLHRKLLIPPFEICYVVLNHEPLKALPFFLILNHTCISSRDRTLGNLPSDAMNPKPLVKYSIVKALPFFAIH
jgi:hypothetical protein